MSDTPATPTGQSQRYGAVAMGLHWLMAALFLVVFVIAFTMGGLPAFSAEQFKAYNLHKSVGLTILALAALRLLWRRRNPPPPLPAGMPAWERKAAAGTHHLLYLLIFLQPVIGVFHSWTANLPIEIYSSFILPNPIGPMPAVKEVLEELHELLGFGLLIVILLHVAAALRHHFLLKDDVLRRMLPGRSAP